MDDSGDDALAGVGDEALPIESDPRPCPYLPDRIERDEAWVVRRLEPAAYRALLDRNYRRAGHVVYRPRCPTCRSCRQLRVPVGSFRPSRSQRRCLRRNRDLSSRIGPPRLTAEKAALYARYIGGRHAESDQGDDPATLAQFLHDGCLRGLEIESRDASGRLVCVSHVDPLGDAWSSVYCYFDPEQSRRSLGTWSILVELEACRALGLRYYYLGFWVEGAKTMEYKARFLPCEVLTDDGWSRRETLNPDP